MKYFAQEKSDKLTSECMKFINESRTSYGIYDVRERNTSIYYQNVLADPISPSGSRGELVSMSIPKARKLVRDYISIIVKQKLKFKALMKTHEYKNWEDVKITDALIENIVKYNRLEDKRDKLAEQAYVLGQSFLWTTWNQEAGRDVLNPLTGLVEKGGAADIKVVHPNKLHYNIIQGENSNWNDVQWCIVENVDNKYNLGALHPEFKEELESLNYNEDLEDFKDTNFFGLSSNYKEEIVKVYHFYHKASPALPQGRMVIFCSSDIVLYDGPNPYEQLPVFPCIPETVDSLLLGYPAFSNLVAAQEMLDHNYSVIASNQSVYGLQSMLNPTGSNLTATQVFGINFVNYTPAGPDGGGKPEPINFPSTPAEVFSMVDRYGLEIDNIGGLNSALRGQAPGGVTAASAIATLTANSLEFMNSYSRSIHTSITEAVSFAAKLYYSFGSEIQYLEMNTNNMSTSKEYKRDALKNFEKVDIDLVNPLLNSYSFNLNSANELLSQGIITDPKTYFRVLEGDRTSIMYDDDLQEQMLVQLENDDMMEGQPCTVLFHDTHALHIQQHKKLLMNPELRRQLKPEILQLILQHIEEHEQFNMPMQSPLPEGSNKQLPPPQNSPEPAQPASPAIPKVSL